MNSLSPVNYRSRQARVNLTRHIARREAQWHYIVFCVYTVMHQLQQRGWVSNFRVYDLNSPEAKAGCNCRFELGGRRRRVLRFGLAISRRTQQDRQLRYPSVPQLLVRTVDDLVPEICALVQLPRQK